MGSIPGQGTKIPHAAGKLSSAAATGEACVPQQLTPMCPEPALLNNTQREALAPQKKPSTARSKTKSKVHKSKITKVGLHQISKFLPSKGNHQQNE